MRQLLFITRLVPNRHEVNGLCAFSPVFVTCIACIRAMYSGTNWELAQLNGTRGGSQVGQTPARAPSLP